MIQIKEVIIVNNRRTDLTFGKYKSINWLKKIFNYTLKSDDEKIYDCLADKYLI